MVQENITQFLVDGIQTISIHNGVARIQFMRLDVNGKPSSVVELDIPMNQVEAVSQALTKITQKTK